MAIIKREIGTIENVKENEIIPQMLIVPTEVLEKQADGSYCDFATGTTFRLEEDRFLVTEVNGFTYVSVINSFYKDGVENFDKDVNQRNKKIGFVLSNISKDRIANGIKFEDAGVSLDVVGWHNEYDGDSYLSGIKCINNGREVVFPVVYYGNYSFSTPSCSDIIDENLAIKSK